LLQEERVLGEEGQEESQEEEEEVEEEEEEVQKKKKRKKNRKVPISIPKKQNRAYSDNLNAINKRKNYYLHKLAKANERPLAHNREEKIKFIGISESDCKGEFDEAVQNFKRVLYKNERLMEYKRLMEIAMERGGQMLAKQQKTAPPQTLMKVWDVW